MNERDIVMYCVCYYDLHGVPNVSLPQAVRARLMELLSYVGRADRGETYAAIQSNLDNPVGLYNIVTNYFKDDIAPKRKSIQDTAVSLWGQLSSKVFNQKTKED